MKAFATIFFLAISNILTAQNFPLSSEAQISIVTCGSSQEELYTAFGHSAFHVLDPVNGIDFIYNYGVFDFNQPNFYLNYALGKLYYRLARHDYEPFKDYYIYHNRSFSEQYLNLTSEEKQKLFDFLEWNNLPENQMYMYDYFYDNCATRVRDVLNEVFKDRIDWSAFTAKEAFTIRDLTDQSLRFQPWGDLGIDLCLGMPMDKEATPWMYMFLPEFFAAGVQAATIERDGSKEELVAKTDEVFTAKKEEVEESYLTPELAFNGFATLMTIITLMGIKKNKYFKWIDVLYFSVISVLGLFLMFLWFLSDHKAAAMNLNVLWAWPLYLIGIILLFTKRKELIAKFFKSHFFLGAAVVAMWFFLPQDMHPALLGFAVINTIRSYRIFKFYAE